jgi:hypothetical protein
MQRGSKDLIPLQPDYEFNAAAPFNVPAFPKMHFIENRYAHDETNWWVPNRACVEAMLRSSGFSIEAHPEHEVYLRYESLSGQKYTTKISLNNLVLTHFDFKEDRRENS